MEKILRRAGNQKIVLFEPWGLGDLAISLGLARSAHEKGLAVTLLCDPKYVEWAKTFSFVSKAYGISIPWTRKTGKYRFFSYPWSEWLELRRLLHNEKYLFAIEPRRDTRAQALLKFLLSSPLQTPASQTAGLGYERWKILPLPEVPSQSVDPAPASKTFSIVCFFGAEWVNRRVPAWKIPSLLEAIRKTGAKISVIIPPDSARPEDKDAAFYADLRNSGVDCIRGPVTEVANRIASSTHCISTDSGWLHVAHLYGLRTLGLFGFQNEREWMPPNSVLVRSEHCLPGDVRYDPSCEDLQPLGTLRIEAFSEALKTLMG